MHADENITLLRMLTDELAEQGMDPNPWLDPVMPSLLSMLRTKLRTLSRDLHVPAPAPRDRCSNFNQFQASIALKLLLTPKAWEPSRTCPGHLAHKSPSMTLTTSHQQKSKQAATKRLLNLRGRTMFK